MVDTWILTDGSSIANECVWKDAPSNKTRFVTHADYRSLEERYETLWEVQALTTQKLNEAHQELASLRARVGEFIAADAKAKMDGHVEYVDSSMLRVKALEALK